MERRGSGLILFSAIVLGTAGVMRIFDGIWALRYKGQLPQALHDGLLGDTLKNYGWLWLVVGILLLLAGIAVSQGSQVGRWVGIVAAAVLMFTSVFWLPYYPIWSMIYVAVGVTVLYALAAYGGPEGEGV